VYVYRALREFLFVLPILLSALTHSSAATLRFLLAFWPKATFRLSFAWPPAFNRSSFTHSYCFLHLAPFSSYGAQRLAKCDVALR
jgi:hypothetical protein